MRKSTIWLLAGVMIFAFVGLLYLQVNYIHIILNSQQVQFKDAVKRSLFQVSRDVELDETSKFLEEQILSSANMAGRSRSANRRLITEQITTEQQRLSAIVGRDILKERIELTEEINKPLDLSSGLAKGNLSSTSQAIQDALYDQYLHHENLLNEVIRSVRKANERPIDERIEFKKLETYIQTELANNGLELNFQYAVVDNKRNVIYSSNSDFNTINTRNVFSQILFPKDPPSKLYTLQVIFPEQNKYVLRSISFIIPSVGFTIVLLVIFIITLYVVLRQKRLSEMNKDFISNMTHELKTPVASISIAGQMLSDDSLIKTLEESGSLRSSASFNKITRTIIDETKRLHFLIDKVLQMSLVEDGKSILKIKEVDANDLLLNVAQIFDIQVEKCGGKLELELEALESTIYVDEMHFTNVLFNLMENAVKYRRPEVSLELLARTENVDDKILISIQDNGKGIKKENLKRIFERFYRVNTGNVHNVKGFGLGLAYVKKIVDETGGTIKVESELNAGTKFTISLPYAR